MFKKVGCLILVCIIAAIGAAVYIYSLTLPPGGEPGGVRFEVSPGTDVNAVSKNLKDAGLIRSSFAFETLVWILKAEGKVRAGIFILDPRQNVFDITNILISGAHRQDATLTFIEGWHRGDYASYLTQKGFDGKKFEELTADAASWTLQYPFLSDIPPNQSLEGYLFPDTYAISSEDFEPLLRKMLVNFKTKLDTEVLPNVASTGYTLHEIVTLASIVEKEVSASRDRKIVADIFLKRLKDGIALQSDATVNFITKSGRSRSTAEDLAIDSAYNTYKYRGLPPGPIGNPSLDAFLAVIAPEKNDYYYFLTDRSGTVYYGKTFEDHKRNREAYLD